MDKMGIDLPDEQRRVAGRDLPGMQPVGQADWITCNDDYAAQLAEKARIVAARRDDVIAVLPQDGGAVEELLDHVLGLLDQRAGFTVAAGRVVRPDGQVVTVDRADPLGTLSRLVQEDLCVLQKSGDEHVMTAALLGFPAGWTLREKIGKPLVRIHRPVAAYDDRVAARVQRLFDGVQVERPIWRANLLRYVDPALYQPRKEASPERPGRSAGAFERSERQTLFRLPDCGAVVFSILTTVVKAR